MILLFQIHCAKTVKQLGHLLLTYPLGGKRVLEERMVETYVQNTSFC